MPDQPETFRVCKVTIPLLILQILDLYDIPNRFYESLNEQNQMCELCTFSQIRSHRMKDKLGTNVEIVVSVFTRSNLGMIQVK